MLSFFTILTPRLNSRSLRVCKNWKSVLEGKEAEELWRIQHYSWSIRGPKRPVKIFKRYAFFAGNQVTDLSIDNCKHFGLDSAKLDMIASCCKQLKHLKLRGAMATPVMLAGLVKIQFPTLETLYLGIGVRVSSKMLVRLLRSSPKIQELSVFDLADHPHVMMWPILKKLKTLRLASGGKVSIMMPMVGISIVVNPLLVRYLQADWVCSLSRANSCNTHLMSKQFG